MDFWFFIHGLHSFRSAIRITHARSITSFAAATDERSPMGEWNFMLHTVLTLLGLHMCGYYLGKNVLRILCHFLLILIHAVLHHLLITSSCLGHLARLNHHHLTK